MASAFEADSAAWGLQKKEVEFFSYGLLFENVETSWFLTYLSTDGKLILLFLWMTVSQ